MADNVNPKALDFKLCIVCQKETQESLIENPKSHEKLLEFIGERVKYGDSQYSFVWQQLQYSTVEQLATSNASWHRRCYQEVTHIGKLKRARERSEIEENTPKPLKQRRVEQKFTR